MFKKIVFFLIALFLLTSCSSEYDKKLKVSVTTWIGYAPLFYAKEKGWLEPLNIKLLNVVSLSENMHLYKAGNSDAYAGTQYEYSVLSKKDSSLIPVMMFDRSNGGDVIMSNFSIEDLQNTDLSIDAYLEMDSINNTLLKDFIEIYKLQNKKINYMNNDQTYIATLKNSDLKNPTLLITYVPYDTHLKKNGFKEIASTKDGLALLVVDAMFTTSKVFHEQKKQFVALKKLVDISVKELEKDPKEFYKTVKAYFPDMNYEEFLHSLSDIVWINQNLSDDLLQRMKESGFPTRSIL